MEVEDRQAIKDALTRCEPGKLGMGLVRSPTSNDNRPVVFISERDGNTTLGHMFGSAEALITFIGTLSQMGITAFGQETMDASAESAARRMANAAALNMSRKRTSN